MLQKNHQQQHIITKAVDNEARQYNSDCFGVSLILTRIMQHFSNRELLELSLVNKQWSSEARSLLRSRGTLVARLGSDRPYQGLMAFASDLIQMPVVPFSGIRAVLHGEDFQLSECRDSLSEEALGPYYKVILDRLRWKYISIEFSGYWEDCTDCPALVLVQKVLEGFCGVLEELSFTIDRRVLEIFQKVIQYCYFPLLRTLRIQTVFSITSAPLKNFLTSMASSAPILKEIWFNGNKHVNLEEALNHVEHYCSVLLRPPAVDDD